MSKTALDYFYFDVGLLKDRKFNKAKMKHGYLVLVIYLAILEMVYGDKGYYLEYSASVKDDVLYELQDYCKGKYTVDFTVIGEVIEMLTACGLFSDDRFKQGIITSKRIQETYYRATVERRNVAVDPNIWMLTPEDMRSLSGKSSILSFFENRTNIGRTSDDVQPNLNKNRPNFEENRPNCAQSKVKESKVNKSKVKERVCTPSLDDVKAYVNEIKSSVDPMRFYDYYEAQGWKIGSTPISDWKAKLRNWEQKEYKHKTDSGLQVKKNAFNGYEQRAYTDDELDEIVRRKMGTE